MHFTYDATPAATELMQGDVLSRTPALDAVLAEVHPHYQQHSKNLYFMVLTQSCDLVVRQGGRCKAPYISLVPVRSLDLVVERYLSTIPRANVSAELPVLGDREKSKASEFLRRLFNNNAPGCFYLESNGTALDVDCVAFLNLSIALKSELHLKACLDAKILQLDATFQAKLGWLVGQMYSRVGTPDWDVSDATKKAAATLKDAAIWINEEKIAALEASIQSDGQRNAPLTKEDINRTIAKAPTRKQLFFKEADRVIAEALGEQNEQNQRLAEKLRKRLENDASLSLLLK